VDEIELFGASGGGEQADPVPNPILRGGEEEEEEEDDVAV
jgi:hypothetical protein